MCHFWSRKSGLTTSTVTHEFKVALPLDTRSDRRYGNLYVLLASDLLTPWILASNGAGGTGGTFLRASLFNICFYPNNVYSMATLP